MLRKTWPLSASTEMLTSRVYQPNILIAVLRNQITATATQTAKALLTPMLT